jgi:hypothetical protein
VVSAVKTKGESNEGDKNGRGSGGIIAACAIAAVLLCAIFAVLIHVKRKVKATHLMQQAAYETSKVVLAHTLDHSPECQAHPDSVNAPATHTVSNPVFAMVGQTAYSRGLSESGASWGYAVPILLPNEFSGHGVYDEVDGQRVYEAPSQAQMQLNDDGCVPDSGHSGVGMGTRAYAHSTTASSSSAQYSDLDGQALYHALIDTTATDVGPPSHAHDCVAPSLQARTANGHSGQPRKGMVYNGFSDDVTDI